MICSDPKTSTHKTLSLHIPSLARFLNEEREIELGNIDYIKNLHFLNNNTL